MEHIRRAVTEWVEFHDLSLSEVSRQAQVSRPTVRGWLNGTSVPSVLAAGLCEIRWPGLWQRLNPALWP